MSARPTCDECGTALPANALQGLCPQYLVAMGLNLAAATEQARCKPPYLTEALEDSSLPLLNAKRKSPRSRDLEMICLKCLNKDPQRLHRSAKIFSKTRGLRHVSTLTVNKTTKGSRKESDEEPPLQHYGAVSFNRDHNRNQRQTQQGSHRCRAQ